MQETFAFHRSLLLVLVAWSFFTQQGVMAQNRQNTITHKREGATKSARDFILTTHAVHPSDLHEALENDGRIRAQYVKAHLSLAKFTSTAARDNPERVVVDRFCHDLISDALSVKGNIYFTKLRKYSAVATPTISVLRERLYRTWMDALPLTPKRRTAIATAGGFSARQKHILVNHSVLIMDNASLNSSQLGFIDNFLDLIPSTLHDLRAIGFVGKGGLGDLPAEISWWGFFGGDGGEINSFNALIGDSPGNPFPSDVPSDTSDLFCSAMAHEVNHIVDAFYVQGNPRLLSRRTALVAAAGRDPKNYLRSMFDPNFFVGAPQEFFASIANQWFCNSERTLQLGLVRFDNGRLDPINQALFFAEVYSQGGAGTYFYEINLTGKIIRRVASLGRDAKGHINRIRLGNTVYSFDLDDAGNVLDYRITSTSSL